MPAIAKQNAAEILAFLSRNDSTVIDDLLTLSVVLTQIIAASDRPDDNLIVTAAALIESCSNFSKLEHDDYIIKVKTGLWDLLEQTTGLENG